jgi:hypothetical protein
MIIVLEGLTGKNASEKVTYGGFISGKMTGNTNFPTSALLVTAMDTATGLLLAANEAGIVSTINVREAAFDLTIKAIVLNVQGAILGVEDTIALDKVISGGFEGKKKGKINIPDLTAKAGLEDFSVELRRKAYTEKQNCAYVWEISTDGINFEYCKTSNWATVTVTGLASTKKYWFRVAVIVGNTQLEFSDATDIVVA